MTFFYVKFGDILSIVTKLEKHFGTDMYVCPYLCMCAYLHASIMYIFLIILAIKMALIQLPLVKKR